MSGSIPRYLIIILCIIPILSFNSVCQEDTAPGDSVKVRHHSPSKAVIMSAVVPGLGQIYNGKVWKLPIIYGGEMTAVYLYHWNDIRYDKIMDILKADGATGQEVYYIYGTRISSSRMTYARDHFRRQRDICSFVIAGIYVLNIIDALVDAHFFEYDISDDLSLEIQPGIVRPDIRSGSFGLNVCMRF
jgi:hypothetical protein